MGDKGTTLGRYELGRYLGRGGMGEVYLARVTGPAGFEKRVAIKILPERFVSDAERSRRLMWEAVVSCQLDHANLVSGLDAGDDDGRPFVVMEYVRGHNLATVLEFLRTTEERVPVDAAVCTVRAIARALEYIHAIPSKDGGPDGLIHGDVSPSNVLLGVDGRVKLSDFGVASTTQAQFHQGEGIAGKLAYLPPDAFSGRKPRRAWDVYALGCTFYEMIAGVAPFAGEGFAEHQRALEEGAAPLRGVRSDCPAALAALIERSIARDADARFDSAAAFLAALDEASASSSGQIESHRDFVAELFERSSFVERFGALPSSGSISTKFTRVPPRDLELTPTTPSALSAPLRFGLSPALGADLARSYGADLAAYLGPRLGRTVLTTVFADYHTLCEAVSSGEVDVGWMPPLSMLEVIRNGGGALVGTMRGGRATYQSAIFVRADSAFHELTDLRGARFAWVDRESSSGYRVAVGMLREALGGAELGQEHFHGSHRGVCEAVLHGWADAGATYATCDAGGDCVSAGWKDVLGDRVNEVRPIAVSPPIPCDGIAHRPGMLEETRGNLRSILVAMGDDPRGHDLLERIFNSEALAAIGSADVTAAARAIALTGASSA